MHVIPFISHIYINLMEVGIFIIFIALVIFFRFVVGGFDHDRVDSYISKRGGRIINKNWSPFGTGWFGEKDSRIYELTYEDSDGNIHEATCKTSMMSGVYFTEDRIVNYNYKVNTDNISSIAAENKRLREEIERLKNNNG